MYYKNSHIQILTLNETFLSKAVTCASGSPSSGQIMLQVSCGVCQQVALSFLKAIGGDDDIDGLCDSD